MPAFGDVEQDRRRHGILERLRLLGAEADPAFDRLTRVAAAATGSPMALLTLLGPDRQWIPSRIGWTAGSTPLADAFCRCAVGSGDLLEVPDARADARFSDNPLVTGATAVRFYAGHPVVFEGTVLGTVCVLDRRPRTLDAAQRAVLADLAGMASDLLTQRSDRCLRLEAKAAERRLRAVEDRFRLLWTTTPDVVVMLGADDLIRFVNPAVRELFGHEPESLLGRGLAVLQPERLREAHRRGFQRYLQSGVRRVDWRATEAVGLHRDGREIPIEISFSDMVLDGERMFAACIRDISARKRQALALEQSEASYRRIVETAAEGIWLVDAEGATSFVNPFMAGMLGHSAEAMTGRRFGSFLADADPATIAAEEGRLHEAHGGGPRELLLRHAGGADAWVRVVSNPIRGADGSHLGALAMVTDITALKAADAARHELAERLREAQKMEAIGALAGGVAHDFNNVLAGILGNVAIALGDFGHNDDGGDDDGGDDDGGAPDAHRPAIEPCLQQIRKGALRGRDLVEQILSFARRQPRSLQPCELNALVEDSIGLLRPTLGAGVRLTLRLAASPLGIRADATQIGQVVTNLCANAGQAIDDAAGTGEVVVGTGRAWLDAEAAARLRLPSGPCVHLWVEDDGGGMSEATRARIFEPFFTTREASEGTGLGLAVVHGIVGSHGGAIAVRSTPGAGSRFDVYLPACEAPCAAPAGTAPAAPAAGPRGHGERVLYVDDDEVVLTVVERLLQQLGYEAVAVGSAAEALAALQAAPQRFDAVVSDFNMPGLSGLQLAERLATLAPALPVIISSGNVSDHLVDEAARLGVRSLVRKHCLVEELAGALAGVLAGPPTRG